MHQCPRCELRFRIAEELDDHLITDHSWTPAQVGEVRKSSPADIAERPA